jgi:DNA-binding response OmpR family regulator
MRVLVVEDEPAVRHVIDRMLTSRGHHVLTAASVAEANALLLDFPNVPDLALLDVVLPGMSGMAYAQLLRKQFAAIRIVFMTGYLESAKITAAALGGPLLLKPFSAVSLLEAVEGR